MPSAYRRAIAADPARTVYRGPTDKALVALTFDGGSDRGHSMDILDTLATNGVKATFPLTGQFANANPDVVQRIVREGHQLVNHSYSHPSFTGASTTNTVLTTEARLAQLNDCEAALVNAAGTGGKPWFRPPYGDQNASVLQVLGDAGFTVCLMWSIDLLGWNGLSKAQVISRAMANHGNGYIYLMHVGEGSQEGPALQSIITGLRNFGYGFATVSNLLAGTAEPPAPQFVPGDTIRVTSSLNLRVSPTTAARIISTMPTGTTGTVVAGPVAANGYTWYQIETNSGRGWAATIGLAKTSTPTPPVGTPAFVPGDTVKVTAGLYLRSGPATASTVYLTMPTGTVCTVLAGPSPANGYTWYQVQTSYGTGWAAGEYLAKTGSTQPTPPAGWVTGGRVRVTDNLNLRASPSTSGAIRATMRTGTICTIVGGPSFANGYTWYQLESSYGTGWAVKTYLTLA